MTTVIESSRLRVAAYHIPELLLGVPFPALYVLVIGSDSDIPIWFKSFFGLAAIVGFVLTMNALRKILRALLKKGTWKATIEQGQLVWETAIPHKDFPMQVRLEDIEEAVALKTWTNSTDDATSIETTYELRLKGGVIRAISQDAAGINPHRVFLALRDCGVPYRLWELDKRKDQANEIRTVDTVY